MNKRRVAIIGTRGYPSYYGGFETAVRHLAPYLADQGWGVDVYGRQHALAGVGAYRHKDVVSITTGGIESKSLSTLSHGFSASLHAARRRPSVALVMNVANGFFLPMLGARGIPTLVNVDGIEWDREKWGPRAKAVFRTGARLTARYGTELVFDARAIQDRWRSEFGRNGVFIPYGGTEPGELPVPMGLPSGGYALLVARFVPENSVPEFLIAAEEISRYRPVVLVGATGYGGELDHRARELDSTNDRVTWLGHVSDDELLFSLLQHAGSYFHGHSVGGTNPALVQAMACGAPVVARDTIFNKEVLGERGTFVKPHPHAIASEVLRMMDSAELQSEARQNALARSRELYTWDSVCQQYHNALERLVHAPAV